MIIRILADIVIGYIASMTILILLLRIFFPLFTREQLSKIRKYKRERTQIKRARSYSKSTFSPSR